MNKLSLLQSRIAGGNGIARGSKRPLEFWRELHSKAETTSRIPSLFFSVPCYLRKTPAVQEVDPGAFYAFMKENFKAFKSKLRHGDAYDDLVFLFSDLQSGATQFLNKAEAPAPQKPQDAPAAPEAVNTCTISGNSTHGSIYVQVPERGPGMSLLDWSLVLLLVGDIMAVAIVVLLAVY
ncbi:MAG: hypothetical protein IKY91_04005 [Akkermansia sp.]|nr:hypothetical protein [Akkermansia sp.]